MMDRKKAALNAAFLMLVFGCTVFLVLGDQDLGALAENMRRARPGWLLCGAACVVFFVWGESAIIRCLMRSTGRELSGGKCFLISCIGFFFSCITPSASGGQPMQIYYMKKERIPIPVSALVLMVVTIAYKAVLVAVGTGLFLFGQGFLHSYLKQKLAVFYLGLVLNIGCVAALLLLLFCPGLTQRLLCAGLGLLERLRLLKKKEERLGRLRTSMRQYADTAEYLKGHPGVMARVFLLTLIQRFALFFTTYFVYRSFGLSGSGMWTVILLQAAVSVAVDMLPLPGGMGISEKLFLSIFPAVFGTAFLLPGMLLSRGLSYYIQLLFCAGMTVVGHLTLGRKPIIK